MIPRNGSSFGRAGGRLRRYPGGTENASIFATVRGSIPKRRAASPLTDPLYINCSSYLCVQFHPLHPSAHLCRAPANGLLLPDFYSGATGLSGCFSEGFSLRCSHNAEVGGKVLS